MEVEYRKAGKKGKKGKTLIDATENTKQSKYDLLIKLGFDEQLIKENKKLGLPDKQQSIRAYLLENAEARKQEQKAQVFQQK